MIKEICRDMKILSVPGQPATVFDGVVADNLLDTIRAHRAECVGMAANMIGVTKRIIVFLDNGDYTLMFNPVIVSKSSPYKAKEGCLSLVGERETTRFARITVEYQTRNFKKEKAEYNGYTAQIIQHEIDHINGKII